MIAHSTPFADWVVIAPVLLGLIGGALLLVLRRFLAWQPWLCAAIVLAILVCDAALLKRIMTTGPVSMTMGKWLPPFGISFTADAMGAAFAAVSAFVAFAIVLDLMITAPESAVRDGLYPLVLLLLAGVSGAFLTGDLFNLYVWFEVMLIASFGLIVLAGNPLQLDGAIKYAIPNVIATALFLAALGLLYGLLGTLNMADIIGAGAKADLAPLIAVAALFTLAFGIKAAAFPVNSWLPASYHTPPAAISALLGGLLTKVGVYAIIRLFVMLLPEARGPLSGTIEAFAIATMLLGPFSAIGETNLRRAIGFLLIGGIGVALICVPVAINPVPEGHMYVLFGGISYVIHSILTLSALYLLAGQIEVMTGTNDTRGMHGLYASNSLVSLLFLVLILAVSGIPPFLGFWPKLLLAQGLITGGDWLALFALLINGLLTLVAGARLWSHLFWRPAPDPIASTPQALGAPILLTGTIVLLGLWPSLMLNAASVAAHDLLDPIRYIAAVGLSP